MKLKITLLLCILAFNAQGSSNASKLQTENKIKHIDVQIKGLESNLHKEQDKRTHLQKILAETEKEIGQGVFQQRHYKTEILESEKKIKLLEAEIELQTEALKDQQTLLAKQIRTRYQIGDNQPVKWILNQENPYTLSRFLTYYGYLVESRQHLIEKVYKTQARLEEKKAKYAYELGEKRELEQNFQNKQAELAKQKQYHKAILSSLNQQIASQEKLLEEAQKNRADLKHLLQTLSAESVVHPVNPFSTLRKKLPRPVAISSQSMKPTNQGLTFFAEEGTPVKAVYPGKVVFSDWLKGYGLLIIVDHGQGYMTLYANNQSLFKHKGEMVKQNEVLANVGHTGGFQQNGLYFEVRRGGKAINPLEWLS